MEPIIDELGSLVSQDFCKILGKLSGLSVKLDWSQTSPSLNVFTRELVVPAACEEYVCGVVASAILKASVNTNDKPTELESQVARELLARAKLASAA